MMMRLLVLPVLSLVLVSCGLLRTPVRLAGGMVEGTARATRAAVTAPGEALEKRKQRKEQERRKQETQERATRGSGGSLGGHSPGLGSSPAFGESPSFGEGVPLDSGPPVIPDTADPGAPAGGGDPALPEFDE